MQTLQCIQFKLLDGGQECVAFARQIGSVTINGGVALSGGKHNLVRVGAGWRF
jgi:hypothetical protein